MTTTTPHLALWIPRIAGIMVSIFIGIFALDAFSAGRPFVRALPDFLIHLVPALVLLAIVGASFRWPSVGAITLIAIAFLYAVTMSRGRLDWIVAISGPLLVVGALFLWSWFRHSQVSRA